MFEFSKVMPSFSRTESTSKYTFIIITDFSTTTRAVLSNVWSFKLERQEFENEIRQITNPQIQPLLLLRVE